MIVEYATKIESLPPSQRIHFYELLAHHLTVVIRSVWSNPEVSDAEKVERLKHVNEIMHRVTDKICEARSGSWQYSDEVMMSIVEDYASQWPKIAEEVEWAVARSYQVARTVDEP